MGVCASEQAAPAEDKTHSSAAPRSTWEHQDDIARAQVHLIWQRMFVKWDVLHCTNRMHCTNSAVPNLAAHGMYCTAPTGCAHAGSQDLRKKVLRRNRISSSNMNRVLDSGSGHENWGTDSSMEDAQHVSLTQSACQPAHVPSHHSYQTTTALLRTSPQHSVKSPHCLCPSPLYHIAAVSTVCDALWCSTVLPGEARAV